MALIVAPSMVASDRSMPTLTTTFSVLVVVLRVP